MGDFICVMWSDHGNMVCGRIVDGVGPKEDPLVGGFGASLCCVCGVVVWVYLECSLHLLWFEVGMDVLQEYWELIACGGCLVAQRELGPASLFDQLFYVFCAWWCYWWV